MSPALVFGIILQALAVGLVVSRGGRGTLGRAGCWFVTVAFVVHGATELVQGAVPDSRQYYRSITNQDYIDRWVVLIGIGLLLFAIGYVATSRARSGDPARPTPERIPDWRLPLAIACPAFAFVLASQAGRAGYLSGGIGEQFLVPCLVLAAVCYLLRSPGHLVPILAALSLALTMVGSRGLVASAAIATLAAVARYGRPVRRRQLLVLLSLVAALAVSISMVRASVGRTTFAEQGLAARATSVLDAVTSPASYAILPQTVSSDFVYRIDGNAFASLVLQRMAFGRPPVGLSSFRNDFTLAVPSFLFPGKLGLDLSIRNEETYLDSAFRLSTAVDWLPMTSGVLLAYFGPLGLLVALAVLGALFALLDDWLRRSITVTRLLVGVTVLLCVGTMERGVYHYIIQFRGVLVLAPILGFAEMVQRGEVGRSLAHRDVLPPDYRRWQARQGHPPRDA